MGGGDSENEESVTDLPNGALMISVFNKQSFDSRYTTHSHEC